MKKQLKKIIGTIFVKLLSSRSILSCVNSQGYYIVADDVYINTSKLIRPDQIPVFNDLARKVITSKKTLLWYDRLYIIHQCLMNVTNLPKVYAEVGAYKGGGSYFIASTQKEDFELHTFDTFEGHDKADISDKDNMHKVGMFNDTDYETVKTYLKCSFPQISVYKGRFQNTSKQIKDKKFSFVHLDMDIYYPTKYALKFFDTRLHDGGIILVDDYGFKTCDGIRKAVHEFLNRTSNNYKSFHLPTGQLLLIRCK